MNLILMGSYGSPKTLDPDDVSTTVKAFMAAELPNELIEML